MQVSSTYIKWLEQFKLEGTIVVVSVQTHCALFHSVCDLKAASRLIWKLKLYKFELDLNFVETTKNICSGKKMKVHLIVIQ